MKTKILNLEVVDNVRVLKDENGNVMAAFELIEDEQNFIENLIKEFEETS